MRYCKEDLIPVCKRYERLYVLPIGGLGFILVGLVSLLFTPICLMFLWSDNFTLFFTRFELFLLGILKGE